MEVEVFNNVMEPLRTRWRTAYPNPVMERIYSHVKDLSAYSLESIVNKFIDAGKAPTPDDFRTAARNRTTNVYHLPTGDKPKCKKCDGDGYVSALKYAMGQTYSFAFGCPDVNCPIPIPPRYPRWSSAYEPEYQLRPDDGGGAA